MAEEKTLPASAKKLAELRKSGQVPRSMDLTTTAVLGVGLFGMLYFSQFFAGELARFMISCFKEIGKPEMKISVTGSIPNFLTGTMLFSLIAFMGAIALAAVLSQVLQTGVLIVFDKIGKKGLDAINPINGIKNLFSKQKLVMTLSSILKLIVIVSFAYASIKELFYANVFIGPVTVQELGFFYMQAAWSVGWRILLVLLLISTLDFLYQKWQYAQDNRMSFQDLKDEHRQQEGSPELKGKMRGLARKMLSARRQIENMVDATIVITNPTHYAIALRYQAKVTPTPIVIAKGIRRNAHQIKERAGKLGLAVMENKPLAQGLYKHGQVGKEIPALYYQAVAQVLAEMYRQGYRPHNN